MHDKVDCEVECEIGTFAKLSVCTLRYILITPHIFHVTANMREFIVAEQLITT